jgi:3-ketosteroid 9alpha-monooxygenase subunit A
MRTIGRPIVDRPCDPEDPQLTTFEQRMVAIRERNAKYDFRTADKPAAQMGLPQTREHLIGWPYSDFSAGWYQIGYSTDLKPGEVKPARWLNQDLVMFRTESGKLAVLDAYCRHMGAHLGRVGEFGGGVCGENIQCPFHAWQWDTEGNNVHIPYRPERPVSAKIEKKHVREIDGVIVMWYDSADGEPSYEWPGLPYIGDKSNYYPIDTTVDGPFLAKPQFPMENAADPHHFQYVHGSGVDAEFSDFKVDGPACTNTLTLVFGAGKESTWLTPNGPVVGYSDSFFWGANIGISRFRIEEMVCIHLVLLTPIDHDRSIFFSTVTATKEPGDTGDVPTGRSGRFMLEQHWQIRNDFNIWQNMEYKVHPIFTGEAEQTRYAFLRRHFDQFYPNPVYDKPEDNAGD